MRATRDGGRLIYVCEQHDRLLDLWRAADRREIRLVHVDFHDDLRGLLVDRRRGEAYPIGTLARGVAAPDPGNFLAHAVLEGRVRGLRWFHGDPGGRAWDMGIVRYETDLFALPHRLRQRFAPAPRVPLAFDERALEDWDGCRDGEQLSIDWDCFASLLLDAAGIAERVQRWLDRLGAHVPPESYVVYSPEYCHPTLDQFRSLVDRLAARFEQGVEWIDAGLREGRTQAAALDTRLPRDPAGRLILALRRRGIY